jgi:hypothetical protein
MNFNKFYGVIGSIKIIEDNNFFNYQEKFSLIEKINNTNLQYINIDVSINNGIFQEDEESIRKFLYQIKKFSIKLTLTININENICWEDYIKIKWIGIFDLLIINLRIPPYLISKKEMQKIITQFFYINENKLIVSDNFLILEEDVLKKYSQGILVNNIKNINHNYGTTIFNGLNFFQQNFWNEILFHNSHNIIQNINLIGWQPLEILHSSIVLNDNQLKISIINHIQSKEKYIINQYENNENNLK